MAHGVHASAQTAPDTGRVAQVRALAWSGQHAPAIDLATQTLATDLPVDVRVTMLDLRAESHVAQGRLDLAMHDAQTMLELAQTHPGDDEARRVQALNRLALVQMRLGDLDGALQSATAAVQAHHATPILRAESYFRLAEAQFRTQRNEAAVESAQQAIDLYLAHNDLVGAGRAYWTLANAYSRAGSPDKFTEAARASLNYSQQTGDNYGLGNALNTITVFETDIVHVMQMRQQAIQAFEKAGYLERLQVPKGNLSLTYQELGMYTRSLRLQLEVVSANRKMNSKVGLVYALGNTVATQIVLGEIAAAWVVQQELERLIANLGDPSMESQSQSNLAELHLAAGDTQAAVRHQEAALQISEHHHVAVIPSLAELSRMCLANGEVVRALALTTRATDLHRAEGFAQQDSYTSQLIWWRHTQALLANHKEQEAHESLERAYGYLLDSIQSIRDEGLRRNALNKVETNRDIVQHWVQHVGRGQGDATGRPYPHLNIESNLREPFQRLADTGLRLNALKTASAIQTFLVEEATELSGGERVMLVLENNGQPQVADALLPKGQAASAVLAEIQPHLAHTRLTRTVQLVVATADQPSIIVAPLVAQNQLLGYLYVDMAPLYGTFDTTDRDMLGMLANQGAVALDNAHLLAGLERKVEERTAQLQERVSELQIINAIQQGLASELDFQSIRLYSK